MPANKPKRKPPANAPVTYNSKWTENLRNGPEKKQRANVTDVQIAVALRKSFGNRSRAATLLGVGLTTVYDRVDRSPTLQQVMKDAAKQTIDIAEDVNMHLLMQGDGTTARWLCEKTPEGKERGYGSTTEFSLNPTDIAAIVAAFKGDPGALRDFHSALHSEEAPQSGDAGPGDHGGAAGRSGKRAGRRG